MFCVNRLSIGCAMSWNFGEAVKRFRPTFRHEQRAAMASLVCRHRHQNDQDRDRVQRRSCIAPSLHVPLRVRENRAVWRYRFPFRPWRPNFLLGPAWLLHWRLHPPDCDCNPSRLAGCGRAGGAARSANAKAVGTTSPTNERKASTKRLSMGQPSRATSFGRPNGEKVHAR